MAALIGGGFIGPVHVEALRRIGVKVAGLLGSSPERARPRRVRAFDRAASTVTWMIFSTILEWASSTWLRPMPIISCRSKACFNQAGT